MKKQFVATIILAPNDHYATSSAVLRILSSHVNSFLKDNCLSRKVFHGPTTIWTQKDNEKPSLPMHGIVVRGTVPAEDIKEVRAFIAGFREELNVKEENCQLTFSTIEE